MEEVKRNYGTVDEIEFSLRILNIKEALCQSMASQLSSIFKVEVIVPEDHTACILLINDIDEYNDYSSIINVVKQTGLDQSQINIFISLTSPNDMTGFTVPLKISELHRAIGGTLDFSVIIYE